MKKLSLYALILLFNVSVFGGNQIAQVNQKQEPQNYNADKAAVISLVEAFGRKLQTVSLLAPSDMVSKSIQEGYGDLVSEELIKAWQADPLSAPGRLTSSPWPDRIEVTAVKEVSEGYEVQGEIIEITSSDKTNDSISAKFPITLVIIKEGDRWIIDSINLGAYEDDNLVMYENAQYGFTLSLPESWKGYSILTDQWEGYGIDDSSEYKIAETGPIISIRHPQWTSENPRQDIPIMIFSNKQWDALQQDIYHIGAAPIGPRELGRNSQYVFALPARYNFAFPAGYEEVEDILESNPLQTN